MVSGSRPFRNSAHLGESTCGRPLAWVDARSAALIQVHFQQWKEELQADDFDIMDEESSTIYGLDYHARTLASICGESDAVQFLVGTQSLRAENQVCLLEVEEDSGQIRKRAFRHPQGELWHLAPSPADPELLATCFSKVEGSRLEVGAALFRLPAEEGPLEPLAEFPQPEGTASISCFQWQPCGKKAFVAHDAAFSVVDVGAPGGPMKVMGSGGAGKGGRFGAGKWDPHHNSELFVLTQEAALHAFDARSNGAAWRLDSTHSPVVRDVDFNPNRPYVLVTGGDDSRIRFWDTRRLDAPLKALSEHSHWVWSVRFNPIHDQLVLSGSSDARLLLHCEAALSSEAGGGMDGEEASAPKDGVVRGVEEHEESVYAVAWSEAEPWTFASLSYDGRLIVSR